MHFNACLVAVHAIACNCLTCILQRYSFMEGRSATGLWRQLLKAAAAFQSIMSGVNQDVALCCFFAPTAVLLSVFCCAFTALLWSCVILCLRCSHGDTAHLTCCWKCQVQQYICSSSASHLSSYAVQKPRCLCRYWFAQHGGGLVYADQHLLYTSSGTSSGILYQHQQLGVHLLRYSGSLLSTNFYSTPAD